MFKKYTSIENIYREEFLDRIKSHGFWDDDFIVQEKAHGSNLSYWTTNGRDFLLVMLPNDGPILSYFPHF